VKHFS